MVIAIAIAIAAVVVVLHQRARRWLRLHSAHARFGRLALPSPAPTPYQLALEGYLDALDRCAEDRARRRAHRAPPAPRSLPSGGTWHDDAVGRPPAPRSLPFAGEVPGPAPPHLAAKGVRFR